MIEILLYPVAGLVALQVLFFVFIGKRQSHIPAEEDVRLQKRLRWTGTVVMIVGLVAAGWVYRHSEPGDSVDPDIIGYDVGYGYSTPIRASQSKKMVVAEERMEGKFGVMLNQVQPWLVNRWHGRQLATTLVALAGVIFLTCFWWARLLTFPGEHPIPTTQEATASTLEKPRPKVDPNTKAAGSRFYY